MRSPQQPVEDQGSVNKLCSVIQFYHSNEKIRKTKLVLPIFVILSSFFLLLLNSTHHCSCEGGHDTNDDPGSALHPGLEQSEVQ